jgi:excisionase family DNA binding protein
LREKWRYTLGEELLTLHQVAEELQLHIETIREWVREGKLPAIKLSKREYRVARSDLDTFLADRKTGKQQKNPQE